MQLISKKIILIYGVEQHELSIRVAKLERILSPRKNLLRASITLLFDTNSHCIENYQKLKQLLQQLRRLSKSFKDDLLRQDNLNNVSTQKAQQLSRQLKSAQTKFESVKSTLESRKYKLEQIEKQNKVSQDKHREQIRKINEDKQPIKSKLQIQIEQIQKEIIQFIMKNQNKTKALDQKHSKISQIQKQIQQDMQILQKRVQQRNNNKDLPQLSKASNANLEQEIQKLLKQKKLLETDVQKRQANLQQNKQRKKQIQNKCEQQKKEVKQIEERLQKLKQDIDKTQKQKTQLQIQIQTNNQLKSKVDRQLKQVNTDIKNNQTKTNNYKKHYQKCKKQIKATQKKKKQANQQINQIQKETIKIKKQYSQVKAQIAQIQQQTQKIQDNIILTQNNKSKKQRTTKQKQEDKKITQGRISICKDRLKMMKNANQQYIKTVNTLTAMRQTMARKASSANNQVRQTAEQVKIKQLQILDLTKKYQETQAKLDDYKSLYEQVKTGRNKYVNLIQNASQELAQLKQRIKNLDNQLQILTNQSLEKDRTLQQYKRTQRKQTHKRDQIKKELNKRQVKLKQKNQQVDQNINQDQKQNMIIASLQKDMENLRTKYQVACQSRNYMGIQLIDRNDQLCVLYQKANIQQNHLRKAQLQLKALQDDIRMIKIQNEQVSRKIQLSRKKVQQVPKCAQKLVQLNAELNKQLSKQQVLAKKLQDPQNSSRWRELGGQYPDQQTLNAKINILQQRLNSKKQNLLEKQLILDQITNLSDKLRKDALDGRQNTLQLSQKINQFQTINKDLTRKMKAVIAQLSMFQANAVKMNQQRQQLQSIVQQAQINLQKNLPPTPQMNIQYLKADRDRKRYQQQRMIRQQQAAIEQKYPPFATRTTAKKRPDAYIPDDGVGLSKPYGLQAPFNPTQHGANFRHIRKPKPLQIQI